MWLVSWRALISHRSRRSWQRDSTWFRAPSLGAHYLKSWNAVVGNEVMAGFSLESVDRTASNLERRWIWCVGTVLVSKLVWHLDLRDLPCLETPRPQVAPSLRSGCHSLGPSEFLDPSVSLSNYYLELSYSATSLRTVTGLSLAIFVSLGMRIRLLQ